MIIVKKYIVTTIIGILILLGVFYYLDIQTITKILSKINIYYFLLAGLFYLIMEMGNILKLKIATGFSFRKIFLSNFAGMFLSQLTPGKGGYMYTAYSLGVKTKTSTSKNLGKLALIQGVMMIVKLLTLILAFVYFSWIIEIPLYLYLAFIVPIIIIAVIFLILYTSISNKILNKIPFIKKINKYIALMQNAVKEMSFKKSLQFLLIDFILFLVIGFQFYFLALALNTNISYLTALFLQPLLTAIMFIPISPNALGLTEGGNSIIFVLLGFNPAIGASFAFLLRINTLLFDSIGLIDLKNLKILQINKISQNSAKNNV